MRLCLPLIRANPSKGGDAKPPVYGSFLGQRGCQCGAFAKTRGAQRVER
jgi:hypothetical protein